MSEHKFNVGDRVIDKNFSGQVLIVKRVYQDVIDDVVDVYREGDDSTIVKYFSKNLEHVSDNMYADESILMDEDTQRFIEKVEEKANNPIHHWYDNREYTAYLKGWKIGRNESYEAGYKAGFDEGFIVGMKAVIRNVTRFLKEIQP